MMTQIIVARCAPTPSSPAQVRAAPRLRGSDGAGATEPRSPPFHQCRLANLTEEEE
jgi:hypothetical protein